MYQRCECGCGGLYVQTLPRGNYLICSCDEKFLSSVSIHPSISFIHPPIQGELPLVTPPLHSTPQHPNCTSDHPNRPVSIFPSSRIAVLSVNSLLQAFLFLPENRSSRDQEPLTFGLPKQTKEHLPSGWSSPVLGAGHDDEKHSGLPCFFQFEQR